MTKTKKQLRAEAVERLKMLDEHGGGSFEYAILGSDKMAWRYMDKRDALIDLLTDDEHDDGTRYRIIRDGVYMPNVKGCELRDTDIVDGVDEPDSREKLEADVRQRSIRPSTQIDCTYDDVIRWLDRQAAITQHEITERWAEHLHPIERECGDLRRKVDELTAERDAYREKLSRALDLAHDIGRLQP